MGIIHTSSIYCQEESLNDDETVNAHPSENQQILYDIVNTGSQRAKQIIIDSIGYSFTIKVGGGKCYKMDLFKTKSTIQLQGYSFSNWKYIYTW